MEARSFESRLQFVGQSVEPRLNFRSESLLIRRSYGLETCHINKDVEGVSPANRLWCALHRRPRFTEGRWRRFGCYVIDNSNCDNSADRNSYHEVSHLPE
jgi:hypothetical protein